MVEPISARVLSRKIVENNQDVVNRVVDQAISDMNNLINKDYYDYEYLGERNAAYGSIRTVDGVPESNRVEQTVETHRIKMYLSTNIFDTLDKLLDEHSSCIKQINDEFVRRIQKFGYSDGRVEVKGISIIIELTWEEIQAPGNE